MPENTETGASNAKETESARARLQRQFKMLGTMAAMAANKGLVKTVRIARPIIHGYTGCDEDEQSDDGSNGSKELPPNQLTPGEKTLLMNAGAKLAFEMIELATLAYPPSEGIEPYRAVKNDNGCYPAPHLAHVLSLGKVVQDLLGDQGFSGKAQAEQAATEVSAKQPVLLIALNSDEYGYLTGPIEPRTIRRVALNGRDRTLKRNN